AGVIARAVGTPATVETLTLSGHTEAAAVVVELLLTFALCHVMLNVATSKDQPATGSSGWRSASPSWPAPWPSAASPAACSTLPTSKPTVLSAINGGDTRMTTTESNPVQTNDAGIPVQS